jgi:KDO2-lipid IV(A) lauroyltransferase
MATPHEGFGAKLGATLARGAIAALGALPYATRLAVAGWIAARLVAPLAGFPRRIRTNLAAVRPGLTAHDVAGITRAVPDNFGRTIAELFSPDEFAARIRSLPIEGAGLAALQQARRDGRPSMLVSGHFGNYDAVRAAVIAQGFRVGGLYRPLNNRAFNAAYVATISAIGTPLFERGRRGMGEMIRFLKGGGTLAVLIDQHMGNGAPLTFFGRTAWTATSMAEIALKYGAVVIPCYGIRQPDGLGFRIVLEAPIPPTTPEAMTQALNDSLEAQVRAHMGQWNWMHRRWKVLPHRDTAPD